MRLLVQSIDHNRKPDQTQSGRCSEELRLGMNQVNDGTNKPRVPFQDEDYPGNDPHLLPGFPRLCSEMSPERFWSVSVPVGSNEIRLI